MTIMLKNQQYVIRAICDVIFDFLALTGFGYPTNDICDRI